MLSIFDIRTKHSKCPRLTSGSQGGGGFLHPMVNIMWHLEHISLVVTQNTTAYDVKLHYIFLIQSEIVFSMRARWE